MGEREWLDFISKLTPEQKKRLDPEIIKVVKFYIDLTGSPEWHKIRQLILHIRPDDGRIGKLQVELVRKFFKIS